MALTVAQIDALIEQARAALEAALATGATPQTEYVIGDRKVKRADLLDYMIKLQGLRKNAIEPYEEATLYNDPNF